jgi:hypothetical protein
MHNRSEICGCTTEDVHLDNFTCTLARAVHMQGTQD